MKERKQKQKNLLRKIRDKKRRKFVRDQKLIPQR